jgi:hypothetical protein
VVPHSRVNDIVDVRRFYSDRLTRHFDQLAGYERRANGASSRPTVLSRHFRRSLEPGMGASRSHALTTYEVRPGSPVPQVGRDDGFV